MGIETEYGITQQGNPRANPMLMSSQIVTAYRAVSTQARQHARWDYIDEDPSPTHADSASNAPQHTPHSSPTTPQPPPPPATTTGSTPNP